MLLLLSVAVAWTRPPGKRLLLFVGSNTLGERAVPELARSWLETKEKATKTTILTQGDTIYVRGILPGTGPAFIEIHATGSGDCFKSFLGLYPRADAPCDIGMSSRPINEDEHEALRLKTAGDFSKRGRDPGLGCEHPVAMDGLAIIVHKTNPLSRISFSEIKAIYSRKIVDWKQLKEWKDSGGAPEGGAIVPFRRSEPSGTLDFFRERIWHEVGPMTELKGMAEFTSSGELTDKVAVTPGAIGFVGQGYALHSGVKPLQVYDDSPRMAMGPDQAVFPDAAAVRQEIYPLSRVVYLYTAPVTVNENVASFLRFALSEQGQEIIVNQAGLVKIEGTEHQITPTTNPESTAGESAGRDDGRKRQVILRLHGSNTVGAECAVNLAFNFFTKQRRKSNPIARIEDVTTPIQTPEGEKTFIHFVMCDVEKTGVPKAIEIRPTGSSDAFHSLRNGLCDLGMSSRPITVTERRDLMSVCGDLSEPAAQFALGLDGLAIVVSPTNKVERLTLSQVRDIFLGTITNWSEVGGDSLPIQLHARAERSGTYKYFCDSVLSGRAVDGTAIRHAENSLLSETVTGDPGGIGFVPMAFIGHAKALSVGLDGSSKACQPSEETVRAGTYPVALCRYVYFYVPAAPPDSVTFEARHNWETAREFAESSQSWRGQAIVASSGFVPDVPVIDEAGQARRSPNEPILSYLERLNDLELKWQAGGAPLRPKLVNGEICPRLLFQFDDWVLTPESKNIVNKKLSALLKMYPALAKGGLIAEGWADSDGTDEACREVSLQRARNVASYIRDSLGVEIVAVGNGKSFDPPNIDEANKQQNRRVVIKAATTQLAHLPESTPKPSAKRKKLSATQ